MPTYPTCREDHARKSHSANSFAGKRNVLQGSESLITVGHLVTCFSRGDPFVVAKAPLMGTLWNLPCSIP